MTRHPAVGSARYAAIVGLERVRDYLLKARKFGGVDGGEEALEAVRVAMNALVHPASRTPK